MFAGRRSSLVLVFALVGACKGEANNPPQPAKSVSQTSPKRSEAPAPRKKSWKPAEYSGPKTRWRDCGVYVDGQPVGFLAYGEMPRSLTTVWEEMEIKLPFRRGEEQKSEIRRVPRFRLAEYLEAVGVNLEAVREVQLLGGQNYAIRLTGAILREHRDAFMFRFGGDVKGKALPIFPRGLKLNTSFDKLRAVTVYVDKEPPKITTLDTLSLEGKPLHDIAYFGEPLRGGIHIYKDGRLALFLKRRELSEYAVYEGTGSPGAVRTTLFEILKKRGIPTKDIVEGELIHREEHATTLNRKILADARFVAPPQGRGRILVGPEKTPTRAIMLYTSRKPRAMQ
jgi:hypothetical protein